MSYLQHLTNRFLQINQKKKHSIFNDPHGWNFLIDSLNYFSVVRRPNENKKGYFSPYILEVSSELVASRGGETSLGILPQTWNIQSTLYYYYPSKVIWSSNYQPSFWQITSQMLERISHLIHPLHQKKRFIKVMQVLIHETVRGPSPLSDRGSTCF